MTDHAILAPSSAHRWVTCPGSVGMEAAVPNEESQESREGSAAHWACECALLAEADAELGNVAPNGVITTQEMLDGARLYVNYAMRVLPSNAVMHVEQRTAPGAIHELCWGTPDLWAMSDRGLDLFDYKFGHLFVEVFENEQLICYAADILKQLDGLQDQLTPVHFHIIQPRSFHRDGPIRTWNTTAAALRPHINRLAAAGAEALRVSAPTHSSPDACRDCRARTRCDAFQAAALHATSLAGSSVPFDLSNAEAGRFLALVQYAQKQLDAMETGLETQLTQAMVRGGSVPGWQLVPGDAREAWTVPAADIVSLGQAFGVNLVSKAATPNQARKLGIDESVISQYSLRPKGTVKLVPIDFTQSRKVFGKL